MVNSLLPYRWRSRIAAAQHDRTARGVLDTPPIVPADDGLVIFSMIGTAVVLPYLVAVKSLWHQLGRGRVVILDDGTLTPADRRVLAHHCGNPEIRPIAAVTRGVFPKGGCWERLLSILDRPPHEYWLQLDSDTVTLGPVGEVAEAIATNRAFTLLGGPEGAIGALPFAEIGRRYYPGGPVEGHVQAQVESRLAQLPGAETRRYIRGCAGFAGFPSGAEGRDLAAELLEVLRGAVGEAVNDWGSEQVMSNMLVAAQPGAVLLPYARYLNFDGQAWGAQARLVHFFGTHRHEHGAYAVATRRAITDLSRRAAA